MLGLSQTSWKPECDLLSERSPTDTKCFSRPHPPQPLHGHIESQVPRLACKWEPFCVLRLGSCDKLRVRSYGIEGAISVADHLVWSTEESRNDSYNNNKKKNDWNRLGFCRVDAEDVRVCHLKKKQTLKKNSKFKINIMDRCNCFFKCLQSKFLPVLKLR